MRGVLEIVPPPARRGGAPHRRGWSPAVRSGNATTERSGNATTERSGNATTERGGNATTERGGNATTERGGLECVGISFSVWVDPGWWGLVGMCEGESVSERQ